MNSCGTVFTESTRNLISIRNQHKTERNLILSLPGERKLYIVSFVMLLPNKKIILTISENCWLTNLQLVKSLKFWNKFRYYRLQVSATFWQQNSFLPIVGKPQSSRTNSKLTNGSSWKAFGTNLKIITEMLSAL